MDKNTFLQLEYTTLRAEIEQAKEKRFRISTAGVAIIPAGQLIAEKYDLGVITLALPCAVFVLAVMFIVENNSMMRAGRFIRLEIEPHITEVVGWETWLESETSFDTRLVDKMSVWAFYAVGAIYYLIGASLAIGYLHDEMGAAATGAAAAVYAILAVPLVYVAWRQPRTQTSLEVDRAGATDPRDATAGAASTGAATTAATA